MGKRPRPVDSPDMVKLRDMKLQSHHPRLLGVGGGASIPHEDHVHDPIQ